MTGLIIRNADGNISITSDVPPLTGVVVRKITSSSESLAVGGFDNISSPWDSTKAYTNLSQSVFPEWYDNTKPYMHWFQLYDGQDACPGGFFPEKCGQICTSNTVTPTAGKYLNVYDASGNLTWSVESCVKMPRVIGELYIPPTTKYGDDLTFYNIPINAYFLTNCFFCDDDYGGDSDLGGDSQVQMMAIKRSGTTITFQYSHQLYWMDSSGATVADVYPEGIYIPYATINV